jgi:peptidoglycan/LPS O-acetylase OafA/YrhL
MTNKKSIELNNFNLLRLLAALQVVYIHIVEHLHINNQIVADIKHIISYFPGVPIFFLISGYLITMSYEKNPNIKEYMKNRLLRIFPGLYVCFFISIIILWYFGEFSDVNGITILPWVVAQLSFLQFYNPEFIRDFGVGVINGSLWTISIELCFYLILPFLYVFLKKEFIKKMGLLLIISFGFYYYINEISANTLIYEKLIKVSILPYLFYFLFGITLYKFKDKLLMWIEGKIWIYLGLYILGNLVKIDLFFYEIILQVIFSAFIFSIVFSWKSLSKSLLSNHDFTYGVYISYAYSKCNGSIKSFY